MLKGSVGVFIKGDGTHQLLIGGDAKRTEPLFVTGNISMKHASRSHARVLLRMGEDQDVDSANKSTKLDNWTQIEPGKGLKIHASKIFHLNRIMGRLGWMKWCLMRPANWDLELFQMRCFI